MKTTNRSIQSFNESFIKVISCFHAKVGKVEQVEKVDFGWIKQMRILHCEKIMAKNRSSTLLLEKCEEIKRVKYKKRRSSNELPINKYIIEEQAI